jgi:predicted DNA-binding protein
MSLLGSHATPYRQFPMRLSAEMFDELDRVSKQTRINKTTISRIALKKFLAQIELVGVGNAINELCEV